MVFKSYLEKTAELITALSQNALIEQSFKQAVAVTVSALAKQLPLLVCGNGGSAADAAHLTAELVGRFLHERQPLNAICLSSNSAILTAVGNDYGFEEVFARQVEAYGKKGAVLLGISTSGNSLNVVNAFNTARKIGMTTIALTGESGGLLANLSDILLNMPTKHTPFVQQLHLCIYHLFAKELETQLLQLTIDAQEKVA